MKVKHFCSSVTDSISRGSLFSASQTRDSRKQHYPFVFDSLAARKQSAAYVGGTKVLDCLFISYMLFKL